MTVRYVLQNGMLNNHLEVKRKLLLLRSNIKPPRGQVGALKERVILMTVWIEEERKQRNTGTMKARTGPL